MTKHFSQGMSRHGTPALIDAGYERGLHAAYLTVTDQATGRVLYDDNLSWPISQMRPADVDTVLARDFGLRLPDEMRAARAADYASGAAPYLRHWPDAEAAATITA